MQPSRFACTLAVLFTAIVSGCASSPQAKQTGFLSDYTKLRQIDDERMRYASPELKQYHSYIIDPVEFRVPPEKLSASDRADAAQHFQTRLAEVLQKRNLAVVDTPGQGVARIRIALTDVTKSTWYMKIHPASKLSGAGTGGAAMEGEVVDSLTGKQLGAVVQSSPGSQFNLANFSTVADVNSAIDKWAEQAGDRLDDLRRGG